MYLSVLPYCAVRFLISGKYSGERIGLRPGKRVFPLFLIPALILLIIMSLLQPAISLAVSPGTVITNFATGNYRFGTSLNQIALSNPVELTTIIIRTSAVLELLQYSPNLPGSEHLLVPPSQVSIGSIGAQNVQQIQQIYPAGSNTQPIDLSVPVPLTPASVYHQSEPIFIRLEDQDQNIYSQIVDTVWVIININSSEESELLQLSETSPNSGVFIGYIQSSGADQPISNNGVLTVNAGQEITAGYVDPADSSDTVSTTVLVDPFGLVFDSRTGLPLNGARIRLINTETGQPATIFGDDGISSFPSDIISGSSLEDSSGHQYNFAQGHYRFPFVLPGTYRIEVIPPNSYTAPSVIATADLQTLPGAPFVIAEPGSRGEEFIINPGPAIQIDIPLDPKQNKIWLTKTVNQDIAAVGDFIQYTIEIENTSEDLINSLQIFDLLPLGFYFKKGSARQNSQKLANPGISKNGRQLEFSLTNLIAGETLKLSYVIQIAAGAKPGRAINLAWAHGSGGAVSNQARAVVEVTEDLFSTHNIIIGRVIIDDCRDLKDDSAKGLANVQLFLEDGTCVISDELGRFHFEGVKKGTHVVQLDIDSLPDSYEIAFCEKNTRFAGRPFSRFVDLQGGTLWRTDFYVKKKARPIGKTSLELKSKVHDQQATYTINLNGQKIPLSNLRLTLILPEAVTYLKGSSQIGNNLLADPAIISNVITYYLGDMPADWSRFLTFEAGLKNNVQPGSLITKALLTFDSPTQKNQRTLVADNRLSLKLQKEKYIEPLIILRPRFSSFSADLQEIDKSTMRNLADRLREHNIIKLEVIGHSDNLPIRLRSRNLYANNWALSKARAQSVADYLSKILKINAENIIVSGKGPDEPVGSHQSARGRALNRRVEIRLHTATEKIKPLFEAEKSLGKVETIVQGSRQGEKQAPITKSLAETASPDFGPAWLEKAEPGFNWLLPEKGYLPSIPSLKLAVKHDPGNKLVLLLNKKQVSLLNFTGLSKNKANTVAVSRWAGVDLAKGDNFFEILSFDQNGKEIDRLKKTVHYSGPPYFAVVLPEKSVLLANGKDSPLIAVQLTDQSNFPARTGIIGEFSVDSPYQVFDLEAGDRNLLAGHSGQKPRYQVGPDGITYIKLKPTTKSGEVVLTLPLAKNTETLRVWLEPVPRDWIMVGMAEGTFGYNTLDGNMENLDQHDINENFYNENRLAFYAKGKIKGKWLLTMAYDSEKEYRDKDNKLFQIIDPDTYFTLYGDATDQNYDASSIRKLYLKIEKQHFYAMFGDYQTSLTITELSRYNRSFNGLKSEYNSDRYQFNLFAADTDQAFIKDEIQGDGTSGLYRLSRKSIIINSEKIVIETRNRFHSEDIIKTQTLTRHIDYNIDYDYGTIFFKFPIFSRDQHFNPIYIVADYETDSSENESYTYGGRGAVKLANQKIEIGATYIHQGPDNNKIDLTGLDTTLKLSRTFQLKVEFATTLKNQDGNQNSDNAWLTEITHQGKNLDAKVYLREIETGFGLGQQNASESGTRKIGADLIYQLSKEVSLEGQFSRQYNLNNEDKRDLAETLFKYTQEQYTLHGGLRFARNRNGSLDSADDKKSSQILAGVQRNFFNKRLLLRAGREQSIEGNNADPDYPTRTILGADYKLSDPVSLYAEQEFTEGENQDTQSTRLGLKSTPWQGGQLGTSAQRDYTENDDRLFANLGLTQTFKINSKWSVDGGLDNSRTISHSGTLADASANENDHDYTAVSLGAAYKQKNYSFTSRAETRFSDHEEKQNFLSGMSCEVKEGLGIGMGGRVSFTDSDDNIQTTKGNIRIGTAFRPRKIRLTILDRLDYKFEKIDQNSSTNRNRKVVNNFNANYKIKAKIQLGFQYGAKYVLATFDDKAYSGYTDLTGLELRYDLTRRWDIGIQGAALKSWQAGQIKYSNGISIGHSIIKNAWLSIGYNFNGFNDNDFKGGSYTAQGPFVKFRFKFDQQTVKDAVTWFEG